MTRSLQFRVEVNEQLVEAAARRAVSVNWLVNQLCAEGLERLAPEVTVTAAKKR